MATSLERAIRQLGGVPRDLGRLLSDTAAFVRYLLTTDPVAIGLGSLSAASGVAARGHCNRYVATIASARSASEDVTLAVDIRGVDIPGRYAHFAKRLEVAPRVSTRVQFEYDWNGKAGFLVDGAPSAPDAFSRGSLGGSARYAVTAALLDARGCRLDLRTIYQELSP